LKARANYRLEIKQPKELRYSRSKHIDPRAGGRQSTCASTCQRLVCASVPVKEDERVTAVLTLIGDGLTLARWR
jgi:hypothetical protein